MKIPRGLFTILIVSVITNSTVCSAQEFLPAKVTAALIYKVLTYDRSLPDRFPGDLRIGIVYDRQDPVERAFAADFVAGMQAGAAKFKSGDGNARIERLEYDGTLPPGEPAAWIRDKGIGVVIALSGDGTVLEEVGAATRAAKVNSVCLREGCLEYGIAFGVMLKGTKPKMYVHISRTREEGSNYNSKLLTLCESVE